MILSNSMENIQEHWLPISYLFYIANEEEYDKAIGLLNTLIDEIGNDEKNPLYNLLDTLGTVINVYEEKHYPMPDCDGIGMLSFFMDEHGLTSSDLHEIGSEETLLSMLSGNKELSASHIRALAKRFHVSPAVFI